MFADQAWQDSQAILTMEATLSELEQIISSYWLYLTLFFKVLRMAACV
jgi:hypothetical protein